MALKDENIGKPIAVAAFGGGKMLCKKVPHFHLTKEHFSALNLIMHEM